MATLERNFRREPRVVRMDIRTDYSRHRSALARSIGRAATGPRPDRVAALTAAVQGSETDGMRSLGGCSVTWTETRITITADGDSRVGRHDRSVPMAPAAFQPFPGAP